MISHKHKCIFIHIPKTAGTSINSYFHPGIPFHYKNADYERLFGWCPKRKIHMQHATAKQLLELELVSEEVWNEYFKFTFVRNPWDRAYSDYKWIQEFSGVKGSFKSYLNKEKEFKDILNDNSNYNYLGDHLSLQTEFFDFSGKYKVDYMGKFENFALDIQFILNSLSIYSKFDIHSNKSVRKNDYSLFYTNTMKKMVDELYKDDIEKLDYSFKDNRKGLHFIKKLI